MAIKVANNNSLASITALPSGVSGGAMNLISTQTASSSSTLSFTSNIDDTYDEYVFRFYDIHPATDTAEFTFQTSTNSGSSYGVTATTTFFRAQHNEAGDATTLGYATAFDLAQSTGFQVLSGDIGADADQAQAGYLHLFDPSSTTFVKHFMAQVNNAHEAEYTINNFSAGYFNTTTAIDAVQFKMDSGAIESGVIKLYGIS